MDLKNRLQSLLLYGGLSRADFMRVKEPVARSNHRALSYWSVLVAVFWSYCLLMSLRAADYGRCRPAYALSLCYCIFSWLCSQFLVKRFPKTLSLFTCLFRFALIGGGIGIAVCQWDVRSLTMFCVAIVLPSVFVDSTLASVIAHFLALLLYIALGRNTIEPEIYSWGLGNYILFSVFGFLIGNAINKERFERYVFADSARKLAEMQTRYAYFDQMTGLKNRRAYFEEMERIAENTPEDFSVVMADVNGLKRTNDTFGHEAGDELIIGASECLSAAFGGIDTVYRIGGDEFCVVLAGGPEMAEGCLKRLEELTRSWQGRKVKSLSVSYGVASGHGHAEIDAIVSAADHNMYEHKRQYYLSNGNDRRHRE